MPPVTAFRAQCEEKRHGGWSAKIAELDCEAHAERLSRLREEVAATIAAETDLDHCEIVVRLEGVFPQAIERFHAAHATLDEANRLRALAGEDIRAVVSELRAEKLTMRDIAALLNISPQRVAQLLA